MHTFIEATPIITFAPTLSLSNLDFIPTKKCIQKMSIDLFSKHYLSGAYFTQTRYSIDNFTLVFSNGDLVPPEGSYG